MSVMSLICIHNISAVESQSQFPGLEFRNGSKFPATITIHYNIQGIKDEATSSLSPLSVTLAPMATDGAQTKTIIPNPKRYGLVTVEFDGGIKFYNVIDLISEICVGSTGKVFHSFASYHSLTANKAPNWLIQSLTFKKFDLRGYSYNLTRKWDGLSAEQKSSPFVHDIPSCLHAVPTTPEMTTPFPFCLTESMKQEILADYTKSHPEINVSDDEILTLEKDLIAKGIPLITH